MRSFGKGLLALLVTLSPLAIPIASGAAVEVAGFPGDAETG